MSLVSIIEQIHKERKEEDVLKYLQIWILTDRKEWKYEAMEYRASLNAIRKINESGCKNDAISTLCELDLR